MKITFCVEGIAPMYKAMGKKKKVDIEFRGKTIQDLTNALTQKYGRAAKDAIIDKDGEIEMEFRVVVNMKDFIEYGQRKDYVLNDGDMIHVMTAG